ncbi:uncharacterized protein [Lepeophtheirus salmonis]|uniref:uncharacterized protein n=1 Tax=Lepeophtheirus salmonis TaxID=72036 RepID=UPI001AE782D6|nr:uncharacterized protein LOC121113641 [Lepeophtheirus salmonis]XP_040563410.1 uncharacterized protein LOC121113641 [Lepeophtheirus salmonis]XP_040563411.1 uncharacterized protein LOC121113641 [Lepeophtheirus salmonis]XP_040563413.1 uncharacterized protein LOC121113641 [Lepeophtheirus salmonis]XP_040563414.1 uncharacterized protein LOC121113641 [Lepeophtheirus salmonis]
MCCSRRRSSREDDSSRKCCKGKACCCCCCSKRGATICFSIIGLIMASGVIVPPVWVYLHDQDYIKLFPMFNLARKYLSQINGDNGNQVVIFSESNKDNLTNLTSPRIEDPTDDVHFASREKYKLAIFQLLDDTEEQVQLLAFFSFCVGCLNVPLDVFLFFGATFRTSWALLPWLFFTIIEIIVIGIPFIVYSGLISLYLAAQFELYIEAGVIIGVIVMLFFLSLSSWLTVLRCYKDFGESPTYLIPDFQNFAGVDPQLTQPLLPQERSSHPGGYHLGQYPQYYPPNGGSGGGVTSRQLPSAPPPSSTHVIYPSLANA